MIEIVNHGYGSYNTICSRCRCHFTYELEDITDLDMVICPDCGKPLSHESLKYCEYSKIREPINPDDIKYDIEK